MEAWRQELYLAHHGILGMKWGIRRYQNKDGTLTPEGKRRRFSDLFRFKKKEKKKSPLQRAKEMDDQELRRSVDRLRLEDEYARRMSERIPKSAFQKAKSAVSKALSKAMSDAADQLAKEAVDKAIAKLTKSGEMTAEEREEQHYKKLKTAVDRMKTEKAYAALMQDRATRIPAKNEKGGQEGYKMGFDVPSGTETKNSKKKYVKDKDSMRKGG